MAQGSNVAAAGIEAAGGVGMSSAQYGSGASLMGGAAAVPTPDGVVGGGGAQQGGFAQGLAAMLQDPKFIGSIGKILSSLGGLKGNVDSMDPTHKAMATQMIQGLQGGAAGGRGQLAPSGTQGPYRGDAPFYITPEMASNTLKSMGIPFGGGGGGGGGQ